MARRARIVFAGAIYHVLDRGDRREAIFRDDHDRLSFLRTLGEACSRTGWRVHAYVLMTNHYHLLLETPEPNLVAGMHWFQSTYTMRHNRRHRLSGHLFQGRFKAIVVNPEERNYLGCPAWLKLDVVLAELGLRDCAADRRHYAERLRERSRENDPEQWRELQTGWCLGGKEFRKRMLALLDVVSDKLSVRKAVDAPVRREHGEQAAREILNKALAHFAVDLEEFKTLPKSDARKKALAAAIKQATVVSNGWIASTLNMGHTTNVSRHCSHAETKTAGEKLLNDLQNQVETPTIKA